MPPPSDDDDLFIPLESSPDLNAPVERAPDSDAPATLIASSPISLPPMTAPVLAPTPAPAAGLAASRAPSPLAVVSNPALARPPARDPLVPGTGPWPAASMPPSPPSSRPRDPLVPGGPRPFPSTRPSMHDAFASGAPPAHPSAPVAPPSPRSVGPSQAPPASGRPSNPGVFPPAAGGPAASYERAFRQWSSPALLPVDAAGGDVTFQVYTPGDLHRAPMRSLAAAPAAPKKASVGVKLLVGAIGVLVVALTAAAILAVSSEESDRPTRASGPAPSATAEVTVEPAPSPEPTTISIGDPVEEAEAAAAPPPAPRPPPTPVIATEPVAEPVPKVASPAVKKARPVDGTGGSTKPVPTLAPNPYGE